MHARVLTLSRTLLLALAANLGMHGNALAQEYDSMTAEMPVAQAAIGSVALAKLNIALRAARLQAQESLCQGNWNPIGQTLQVTGPKPGTNSAGRPVWRYQSLRHPHPLACTGVSRTQFFLEMSRHLPAWVTIRPAGYTMAFRLGEIEPAPSVSLARR